MTMAGKRNIFSLSILCIVIILTPEVVVGQHNIQFSQYMFNQLTLNPAYAGVEDISSVMVANRNQWSGAEGAPNTQSVSAQTRFAGKRLGLGGFIINDKVGVHKSLRLSAVAAYHLPLAPSTTLSFGMNAGLSHQRGDYASLGPAIINDPKVGHAAYSESHPEVGMGVFLKTPRLQLGLSSPQLLKENFHMSDTLTASNTKSYYGYARYSFPLTASLELQPGFLLKYINGAPWSYDVSVTLSFMKVLHAGVNYRSRESIDFLIRAQVTKQIQLGYAYDYVIGDVSTFAAGSHELMASFQFQRLRDSITSPR